MPHRAADVVKYEYKLELIVSISSSLLFIALMIPSSQTKKDRQFNVLPVGNITYRLMILTYI